MTDAREKQSKDLWKSFVSGGIAGVVAKTTIAPFERIKIIFMTSSEQFSYRKAFLKSVEIYKQDGPASLWRGNTLTCSRIFFYSSIVGLGDCSNSACTTG